LEYCSSNIKSVNSFVTIDEGIYLAITD